MFDVCWTDPDRELVGQRRARKELKREPTVRDHSDAPRPDSSPRSSESTSDKPFSFFGARNLKKVSSSTKHPKSPTPTALSSKPSVSSSRSRLSFHGTRLSRDEDIIQPNNSHTASPTSNLSPGESPPSPSSRESVFSKWTEPSLSASISTSGSSIAESTSKSSMVQTLGPSSFITRSTEITISPRTPDLELGYAPSEVTITSDGQLGQPLTPPHSPEEFLPRVDTPVHLIPGPRPPIGQSSPSWASSFKPNNPDAWKPPDVWDCNSSSEVRPPSLGSPEPPKSAIPAPESTRRLDEIRRVLQRMANTDPIEIVTRLKDIFAVSNDPQLYQQLEMERKNWMLSCLDNLDPVADSSLANWPISSLPSTKAVKKVLALYETKATAAYLAATHHDREVYHLSRTPLSPGLLPNVHPLFVPIVSPSSFPVAPRLFESIYSLSLPSLSSSPDIPAALRNIHRALAPGGTLRLTIIDPTPCPETLGPHMRAWLDDRLLLNLERRFHCVHPSKLFPIWLADAHLRGEGSTITTAKFAAVPPRLDIDGDLMIEDPILAAKVARAELRTLIGRMLWLEVWGPVVETDRWWWEDPDCLDECRELGTFWEYSLIEAVKDDVSHG